MLTIIPLSDHYWVGVHVRNASNILLCPSTAAAMPLEEEKSGSQINCILVLDLLQNYETGYPKYTSTKIFGIVKALASPKK